MLEDLASQAEKTAACVAGTGGSLKNLPGQVQNAIAGTSTGVDAQVVSDLSRCGSSISEAASSLRQTATQARRSAEAAKTRAAQIEREQTQKNKR